MSGLGRAVLWVLGLPVVAYLAMVIYVRVKDCPGGDCELIPLESMGFAVVVSIGYCIVALLTETVLAVRRR